MFLYLIKLNLERVIDSVNRSNRDIRFRLMLNGTDGDRVIM